MNGDQLGLLAKACPRLSIPPDYSAGVGWHRRGPAALASATGRTLAALGRPGWSDDLSYVMTTADMRRACEGLGYEVVERPSVWPGFGLALILWDGPWALPAAMHWIAVNTVDQLGGGEVYETHAPDRVLFMNYWRGGLAGELARAFDPQATGGWTLRTGLELVRRSETGL